MKIPTLEGLIERRILINYAVDKNILSRYLPAPFRPKLVEGKGMAGICLIRLKQIRPYGFPAFMGLGSENAAHRIAIEWDEKGEVKHGVYIPRRDTNSWFNHMVGGRVFPGVHHKAEFDVKEFPGTYEIRIESSDQTRIFVSGKSGKTFSQASVFKTIGEASVFYKSGAVGFSPNASGYDGLELKALDWQVEPLEVSHVQSSFFENEKDFPKGSVVFDNALLMQNLKHTWNNYTGCP